MLKSVVILFEHRKRELENACLLAVELERRGYKVKIINIYSITKYFLKSDVIIVPHLYNDSQFIAFTKNFWLQNRQIINMQYEQVLNESEADGIHNPSGQAVYAHHIAWGKAQEKAYLSHGISPELINVTGHIAMDLLQKEFNDYFYSREYISERYSIDINKKWVMFISSFSYANISEVELAQYELLWKNTREFNRVSQDSYNAIVNWLELVARNHPDLVVIYRRHPAEKEDDQLRLISKKYNNFYLISDYSIRQWVKCVDKMYTWLSTSLVDAYYYGKECPILRPVAIPKNLDTEIMYSAKKITTYNDFEKSLSFDYGFDTSVIDGIEYYYGKKNRSMAYIAIANLCDQLCLTKADRLYIYNKKRFDISNSGNLVMNIKTLLHGLLFEICKFINVSVLMKRDSGRIMRKLYIYSEEAYKLDQEIKTTKARLYRVVDDIQGKK